MTIPDLVKTLLRVISQQFYADRPREFFRDRNALMKAIARYGYECHQRGWHFDLPAIQRDILDLLNQIKRTGQDFTYLPVYLEGAIRRHIGLRAEELSAQAKLITPKLSKIIRTTERVTVIEEAPAVARLAELYASLKLRPRRKKPTPKPTQQPTLL